MSFRLACCRVRCRMENCWPEVLAFARMEGGGEAVGEGKLPVFQERLELACRAKRSRLTEWIAQRG